MSENPDLVLECRSCGRHDTIGRSSLAPKDAASVVSNQCPECGDEDYDKRAFYHDIVGWKLKPFGLVTWPTSDETRDGSC